MWQHCSLRGVKKSNVLCSYLLLFIEEPRAFRTWGTFEPALPSPFGFPASRTLHLKLFFFVVASVSCRVSVPRDRATGLNRFSLCVCRSTVRPSSHFFHILVIGIPLRAMCLDVVFLFFCFVFGIPPNYPNSIILYGSCHKRRHFT